MQDYHREYAEYYDLLTGHKDYEKEVELLLNFIWNNGFNSNSKILSIGCGIGKHEHLLASHFKKIVGIDKSPHMIEKAKSSYQKNNIEFICCDLKDLKNENFDIVISLFNVFNCIKNLKDLGLFNLLKDKFFWSDKKLLGICLGFQLLGISSTEGGYENGLNLIPAKVEKFDSKINNLKIPHIGFNSIDVDPKDELFLNLQTNVDFYFVHSYRFKYSNLDGFISSCSYGEKFIASFHKDNIYGTQFHPEKSQGNGLKLLKNFFEI